MLIVAYQYSGLGTIVVCRLDNETVKESIDMENLLNAELEKENLDTYNDAKEIAFADDMEVDQWLDDDEDLDLSGFTPSVSKQQRRETDKAGAISIVSSKNGTRVMLSRDVMKHLHHPETVQFGFSNQMIAIAEYLGDDYTSYSMRQSGTKSIVYSTELVKQITERYGLDFRNRTSITFWNVKYKQIGPKTVAFIQMV